MGKNTQKKIDHRDYKKFFPIINKVFRPHEKKEMPNINIKDTDGQFIDRCGIKKEKLNKQEDNYIIEEEKDKLNIIGAYDETINSPRPLNDNTNIKKTVERIITEFRNKLDANTDQNKTVTKFTQDNRAYAPTTDTEDYFCSRIKTENILKKLPNKTSAGIDNRPTIVLKHLPESIIIDYTTIFNNSLNRQYFPEAWKISKIIPIHKKGKVDTNPASYRPISLAPNISKVYEAIISDAIKVHNDKIKKIPDN